MKIKIIFLKTYILLIILLTQIFILTHQLNNYDTNEWLLSIYLLKLLNHYCLKFSFVLLQNCSVGFGEVFIQDRLRLICLQLIHLMHLLHCLKHLILLDTIGLRWSKVVYLIARKGWLLTIACFPFKLFFYNIITILL